MYDNMVRYGCGSPSVFMIFIACDRMLCKLYVANYSGYLKLVNIDGGIYLYRGWFSSI